MKCLALMGVLSLISMKVCSLHGQVIDIGVFNEPAHSNILEIRVRPSKDIKKGQYTAGVFTLRTRSSNGVVLEAPESMNIGLFGYSLQAKGSDSTFNYFVFAFIGSYTIDWDASIEHTIAKLSCQGLCDQATFEMVDNDWTERQNGNYYQEINADQALTGYYQPLASIVTGAPSPPSIRCPANQIIRANRESGAFANDGTISDAIGSDNCPGYLMEYSLEGASTGTYTTLKGLAFPKGSTTVSAMVVDMTGLSSSCAFTVTIF